ncbi:uncharacterized protein PFLUO_LOCUS4062 [Penicillium psychrofluorescens]|uniref:uncharacterized protein n=1 Tax=Penicillium psychrofluorescens TaxID=3158075 RepID=UPI003CCE27D7
MSDPRLIDMEPGGESTQYESIRLYTQTPSKQTGQLGGNLEHTKSETSTELASDETVNGNAEEENTAQKLGIGNPPKDTADKGK